jgi:lysine-specific demethylase/histidyl-hydroxylase NO66
LTTVVWRREHHPDAPRLDDLVADPGAFIAGDLFRRAVHLRGDPARAARFATPAALWADVVERGARTPTFRLVRDGTELPPSTYCRRAGIGHRTIEDVIQPNRVLELHAAGATMVLQGLQLTDPHLARTANNLALDLGHAVQVNAYLTPAAARGLELHFDYHDVFVLQLDGAKHWRVWEPLERTHEPVREARQPMPTFDELGRPAIDVTLTAGDCLYLPRGFPHAAAALEASSGHLTIGVMAATWHQAVRHALDDAVRRGALRGSIRPGDTTVPGLEPLTAHLEPDSVERWRLRAVWRRQPSTRLRPLVAPSIDATTPVRITPGPLLWLANRAQGVELGLGDRVLTMPAEARALLGAVLATCGRFVLADIDAGALDAASVLTVARRLGAEGVIAPVID